MNEAWRSLLPLAVFGYGIMGKVHLRKLRELFPEDLHNQLHVCEPRTDRYAEAVSDHPRGHHYGQKNALFVTHRPMTGIIAVNTPFHLDMMQAFVANGGQHILVEKPIVLASQMKDVGTIGARTLMTAWIIEFSPAIVELKNLMIAHGLKVMRAFVLWKKDRGADGRPTPGDEEDEWPHGVLVARRLVDFNQHVLNESVAGDLSHEPYVNQTEQLKAREADRSFPLYPGASTCGTVLLHTDKVVQRIRISGYSSYLGYQQERTVELLLTQDGVKPSHKARLEFDTAEGDILRFNTIGGKPQTEERHAFREDKALLQMKAFLDCASGVKDRDYRLVHRDEAVLAVRRTAAVIQSARKGGRRIKIA